MDSNGVGAAVLVAVVAGFVISARGAKYDDRHAGVALLNHEKYEQYESATERRLFRVFLCISWLALVFLYL